MILSCNFSCDHINVIYDGGIIQSEDIEELLKYIRGSFINCYSVNYFSYNIVFLLCLVQFIR